MVNFFIFLLVTLFVIFIFGVGFVARFIRIVTKQSPNTGNNRQKRSAYQNNEKSNHSSPNHKKVFTKDEGEYIDYEEIKDN